MAKRRKREKRSRQAQSAADLKRNGLNAFKRGNLQRAIDTWERVAQQTPSLQPTAALAEAYFRRGLTHLYQEPIDRQAGLSDLRKAHTLLPDDACYAYHLGLASHRQDDPASAVRLYRSVRQGSGPFAVRAAYPLALALSQQGKSPADDPVWSDLTADQQTMFNQAGAFRRRPFSLTADSPLLWQALVALDGDQPEAAAAGLEQVLANATNPAEKGVALYYLGVLAARHGDDEHARSYWDQARSGGLDIPRLQANMGELLHRLAEERLTGGDLAGALAAVQEANHFKPDDKQLGALSAQVHERLAYHAANAGQWDTALDHWQAAADSGGESFRLAYHRALAFEQLEDFPAAGGMWREALRRRPRRADHPDAISDDQVAQLWRRAADAYRRAGDYEESVRVYRQALKWDPENIAARLALAEELLVAGRWQAAENELERVLERDPDHIPALLRLGEVIVEERRWWQQWAAVPHWERVLELDPDHAVAHQLLSEFFQDQGDDARSWGSYGKAIEMYEKALSYQPENGRVLAALGHCHLCAGDQTSGQDYLDKALSLANANLDVYSEIIQTWLNANHVEQAWRAMAQAEEIMDQIPFEFYLLHAGNCMKGGRLELARPWLDRAEERAHPDEPVLTMIGEMATMLGALNIGREYLERALVAGQYPGQVYLLLGILYAKEKNLKSAEKHWRFAERIARQSKDFGLRERVEHARFVYSGSYGGFLEDLLRTGGLRFPPLDLSDDFDDEDDLDELF